MNEAQTISVNNPELSLAYLRRPDTIRDHCQQIRQYVENNQSYFVFHPEKWSEIVAFVKRCILTNYPELNIPLHSRWRHFNAGGIDRLTSLNQDLKNFSTLEIGRIRCELVILSVLLDAGAGEKWSYFEASTQTQYTRSEGLAVASLQMYKDGLFSSDPSQPFCADGEKLSRLSVSDLQQALQVSQTNPLIGLEGRCELLNRLGQTLIKSSHNFHEKRLGSFYNKLYKKAAERKLSIEAKEILAAVLESFTDIWPSRIFIGSSKLGDVGRHHCVRGQFETNGLVPFHKLSQWLSYSLVEPLLEGGVTVTDLDQLTGLAEYRNGGLFIDGGLLSLRDLSLGDKFHNPDSELISEWRALTICYLDRLADEIRKDLHKPKLALGNILQGGTWVAGRELAFRKRKDGSSPIKLLSDGTIF